MNSYIHTYIRTYVHTYIHFPIPHQVLLNPFYKPGAPIQSKEFLSKVKAVARKYL